MLLSYTYLTLELSGFFPFPSPPQHWPQNPYEVEDKNAVSPFLKGHFSESFLKNWKEEQHNGNHFAASSMAIYLSNHFI